MKKIFITITALLFIWFTLDMSGLTIGNSIIVEKAWNSADGIFWLIFLVGIILFVIIEKVGLIYLSSFYGLWFLLQYIFTGHYIIFPDNNRIEGYNRFFENTHHIIKPSSVILVPDTYHIVLFALIISACTISLIYIVKLKIDKYKKTPINKLN